MVTLKARENNYLTLLAPWAKSSSFADDIDQDQTAQNVQSSLDLCRPLVNFYPNKPCFLRVCSTSLLKTLEKGEIARNEQFLLFSPTVFSTLLENF